MDNSQPPEGDKQIKVWPFNGYAPGNYENTCRLCNKDMMGVDKLCFVCLECAVLMAQEYFSEIRQSVSKAEGDKEEGKQERTQEALLDCANWLSQCLGFGWRKDQLDDLEKIWWMFHDNRGKLTTGPAASSGEEKSQDELWVEFGLNFGNPYDWQPSIIKELKSKYIIKRKP